MLVGDRARVDDVARAFEALVMRRIPEKRVRLLEQRNDLLAARGSVAADDMADAVREHVRGHRGIARVISSGIGDDRINLEIPVLRLRFGDAQQGAAKHALRDDAVRSVRRNQDADRYAQSGHRQLELPSMSAPPVELLSAPLPWHLEVCLAGSLLGRFAPRLTSRTRRRLESSFGLKKPSNSRARPSSSRNSRPLGDSPKLGSKKRR